MSPKKAPKIKSPNEELSENVLRPKEEEIRPLDELEKPFSIEELRESMSWSTRKIFLKTKEFSARFYLVPLSQKKKYGTRRSVKLSEEQTDCIDSSLSLTDNLVFMPAVEYQGKGKLTKNEKEQGAEKKIINKIIPAGIKRLIRVDEEGDYVHRKEIVEYNGEERLLPVLPSSLYYKNSPEEIQLTDLMFVDDILDTDVNSRYILFPDDGESDADFKDLINNIESLNPPKYLAFKFNFTANTEQKDAYLINIEENDIDYILMCVGTKIETQWVGLEELPEEYMYFEEKLELEFDLGL